MASFLCAISPNITFFILLRFIQGVTGAAGIVIARAAARAMYSGKELTKFIALLTLVNGAAPILAPVFGGFILNWFTWHIVFYILAFIGLTMLIAVLLLLPETLHSNQRSKANLFAVFKTFGSLIKDHFFFGIALAQAFVSMSMFAYIAGSPFVLQNVYGASAQQFSFIFAMNGLGIIIAAQLTGKLAMRFHETLLMKVGMGISFTGSLLFISAIYFQFHLAIVLLALFLVVSSVGIVNTAAFSIGLERRGEVAGSASAFLGILPFGGGALVSPLVGIKGEYAAEPLAIVILSCAILSLLTYYFFMKKVV
ncbi:MAG TPA: Bcr/CflA family efflux MFS transporter [Pseudogracilibacillus sp.]|nr:Bcr/CflA family efflux MFS transporter [Pseudogracilibacillus sp.]